MTELDEIVLITKMAYALRTCPSHDIESQRRIAYRMVGVDLDDYIPGLRERLDRKAIASETIRRRTINNPTIQPAYTDAEYQQVLDERYSDDLTESNL
jgi:hypothetical protein